MDKKTQDKIQELVKKYKGKSDYLEVRLENNNSTEIKYIGKGLDNASTTSSIGGYVRSCYKGAWGFCSFNNINDLETYIENAIKQSTLLGGELNGKTTLAHMDPTIANRDIKLTGKDPRKVSLKEKIELFKHYHGLMLSYSGLISSANAVYREKIHNICLVTSEGTALTHGWADLETRFSATSKKDGNIQVGSQSYGSRKGYEELEGLDAGIIDAARRSVESLDLNPPKAGNYTLVIDPILTGLFVHEAFGHLSEADFIYENPKMQEFMVFGKKFGESFLNIYDGAQIEDHRGSYDFDDEGMPCKNTPLIQEGVLTGRLHSRETAGKMGEEATGNARCLDYRFPPIVRMTNTWIEPQDNSPESLLYGIKEGIWAGNWQGGQTNGEMFTFASGEARMIRNGKLAEPIKDVNLTGNVFKTLQDIEAVGNNMFWDESGGCGKGGQNGLPVGAAGPSIRVKDVVVAGS